MTPPRSSAAAPVTSASSSSASPSRPLGSFLSELFHQARSIKKARSFSKAPGFYEKFRRRPTLPHRTPCSTIGAEELNFRVRDGNGCFLFAIATENFKAMVTQSYNLYATIEPQTFRRSCKLFCGQAARPISTSKLNALPHLYPWPINLVFFKGPLVLRVSTKKGYLILG